MLKQLLLIITLVLSLDKAMAGSSTPPALPDPTILSIEADLKQEIEDNNKSWWEKVKEFFGFSEPQKAEEISTPQPQEIVANEPAPTNTAPDSTTDLKQDLPILEQTTPATSNISELPTQALSPSPETNTTTNALETGAEVKQEELKEILSEFADEKKDNALPPPENTNNTIAADQVIPEIKESDLPNIPVLSNTPPNTEVLKTDLANPDPNTSTPAESTDNSSPNSTTLPSNNTAELIQNNTPQDPMSSGISVTSKDRIEKYKQQIQEKLKETQALPSISTEELNLAIKTDDSALGQQLDDKQFKFVTDETKMLLLPEDDIVLGKLSEEAILSTMDLSSYLDLFWKGYAQLRDKEKRNALDQFIQHYEANYNSEAVSYQNNLEILNEAFYAINKGFNEELKILLDHYDILQLSDNKGNTMLHVAAAKDNYSAAKILLMRGIKYDAVNQKRDAPIMIAKRYNKQHIKFLLEKASGL